MPCRSILHLPLPGSSLLQEAVEKKKRKSHRLLYSKNKQNHQTGSQLGSLALNSSKDQLIGFFFSFNKIALILEKWRHPKNP